MTYNVDYATWGRGGINQINDTLCVARGILFGIAISAMVWLGIAITVLS
ncbi:hypothetical protein [Aureimonas leprariae]|nr:hypothetical protein [Aureimonas leprariae]